MITLGLCFLVSVFPPDTPVLEDPPPVVEEVQPRTPEDTPPPLPDPPQVLPLEEGSVPTGSVEVEPTEDVDTKTESDTLAIPQRRGYHSLVLNRQEATSRRVSWELDQEGHQLMYWANRGWGDQVVDGPVLMRTPKDVAVVVYIKDGYDFIHHPHGGWVRPTQWHRPTVDQIQRVEAKYDKIQVGQALKAAKLGIHQGQFSDRELVTAVATLEANGLTDITGVQLGQFLWDTYPSRFTGTRPRLTGPVAFGEPIFKPAEPEAPADYSLWVVLGVLAVWSLGVYTMYRRRRKNV